MHDGDIDLSPDEPATDSGTDQAAIVVGIIESGPDESTISVRASRATDDRVVVARDDVINRVRLGSDVGASVLWVRSPDAVDVSISDGTQAQVAAIQGQLAEAMSGGEVAGFQLADDEVEGYSGPACFLASAAVSAGGAVLFVSAMGAGTYAGHLAGEYLHDQAVAEADEWAKKKFGGGEGKKKN